MSDLPMTRARRQRSPFGTAAIAILVAVGLIGFSALLVLAAFAPERRGMNNGRANALSNGATGFQGIVRLAEATGRNPVILRSDRQWEEDGLLIAIPETGYVDISGPINRSAPTLIIFPKWQTLAAEDRQGWVTSGGPLDAEDPEAVLAPGIVYEIERRDMAGAPLAISASLPKAVSFDAPEQLQLMRRVHFAPSDKGGFSGGEEENGKRASYPIDEVFEPLITDGEGGIVLGRMGSLYVLAEPDLLNNLGMADADQARAALALLDALQEQGADRLLFDATLNGFASTASPLRLMFEPPFLAMTMALLAMAAMVIARAFGRFGEPEEQPRALAFGKAALADSSAALFRKTGRTHRLGSRYADAIRAQARRDFAIPPGISDNALDAHLDRLSDGPQKFSELAAATASAQNDAELLAAARALNSWKQEKTA